MSERLTKELGAFIERLRNPRRWVGMTTEIRQTVADELDAILAVARQASEVAGLTEEDRKHIERYTSFKTDASPITKAMRKAVSLLDCQAAALAERTQERDKLSAKVSERNKDRDILMGDIEQLKEQLAAKKRECSVLTDLSNRLGLREFSALSTIGDVAHRLKSACAFLSDGENSKAAALFEAATDALTSAVKDLIAAKALGIAPAAEGGGE